MTHSLTKTSPAIIPKRGGGKEAKKNTLMREGSKAGKDGINDECKWNERTGKSFLFLM